MSYRRHLLEAATLVLAAVLCALVANTLASRERKLALVGSYPDALKVPSLSASLSGPKAALAPADSEVKAPSEVSSKVNGAETSAPATTATPKAAAPAKGSEAKNSSFSSADLIKRFPPHNKPYVEISGDDATWLVARGVLTLDARRTKDYEQGHIARARSFPVWESDIDARVTALVGEGRDGEIPVVLYCSGGDCEDSHMLAQKLFGAGFNNLLVYRDGWPDWQKRGGKSAAGPGS